MSGIMGNVYIFTNPSFKEDWASKVRIANAKHE